MFLHDKQYSYKILVTCENTYISLSNHYFNIRAIIFTLHYHCHIHLSILVSFLAILIGFFSLSGQVLPSYSIALRTYAECNLLFAPKGNLYWLIKALSFLPGILSSGQQMHIHLTMLASVLSILIRSSSLSGQVSPPCDITLSTDSVYNLHFAPRGKLLLANKVTKSLNFLHPFIHT